MEHPARRVFHRLTWLLDQPPYKVRHLHASRRSTGKHGVLFWVWVFSLVHSYLWGIVVGHYIHCLSNSWELPGRCFGDYAEQPACSLHRGFTRQLGEDADVGRGLQESVYILGRRVLAFALTLRFGRWVSPPAVVADLATK